MLLNRSNKRQAEILAIREQLTNWGVEFTVDSGGRTVITGLPKNKEIYIKKSRSGTGKRQWRYQIFSAGNHKNLSPNDTYHNEKDLDDTIRKFNVEVVKNKD